ELVREYLTPHGFQIHAAHEGHDGLVALRATPPDLVILDATTAGEALTKQAVRNTVIKSGRVIVESETRQDWRWSP
ncbi:MAG: hypothetical protein QF767_16350, partial [Alphaproteobacteria bacterium]|nr:hypothetical protein [Alphaproteobacteria bacterium]